MSARDAFHGTLDFLRQRATAYRLTFATQRRVRGIRQAYRAAFTHPAGQTVLADLAKFCRANDSCYHNDARLHAVLEGRREVWLRIERHLRLNQEQLFTIYSGQQFPTNAKETEDA